MVFLFWFSLCFLLYTFVAYPLLLWLLATFRGRTHHRATIWPAVSIIVAARNEADKIRRKIKNTLELEYPCDKREIIIVSDGSTDATAEIVRSFSAQGVKLIELPAQRGKHYAQMMARDASQGEILVFTDVSVHLEPDALEKIVSNFADPTVGCVSSEDGIETPEGPRKGERSYVHFEMWLRRLESRANSLIGVSGSFFAARREVCKVWHPDQSSDFFVPLQAAIKGLRTVVDPACVGYYGLVRSEKEELRRKVRTVVHGLDVFFSHLKLLNPFRYGLLSWQLVSHKLFRWLVPYALLLLAISNLWLWKAGTFYRAFLVAQIAFYTIGLVGQPLNPRGYWKTVKIPAFFALTNWATLIAWFRFLTGETYASWRPSERT
jgi:glycosyltransferase involved in cell wall biosynthesis